MQIKTIKAATMKEALEKMKTELGPNATVLQTRKYKSGGVMGIGGQETIEITAAMEIEDEPAEQPKPTPKPQPKSEPTPTPQQTSQPQPTQPTQPTPQNKPTVRPRPKIAFKVPTKVPTQPQPQPTPQPQQQTPPQQPSPKPQPTQQPPQQTQQPQPEVKKVNPIPKIKLNIPKKPADIPKTPPVEMQNESKPEEKIDQPEENKIDRIEVTVNGSIPDEHIPDVTTDFNVDSFEDEEPEEVESVEHPPEEIDSLIDSLNNMDVDKESTEEKKSEVESETKAEAESTESTEETKAETESTEKSEETKAEPESTEKIEETKAEPEPIEKTEETKAEPEPKPEIKTDIQILQTPTILKMPEASLVGTLPQPLRLLERIQKPKPKLPDPPIQQTKPTVITDSKPTEKTVEDSKDQQRIQELEKEIARMKSLLEQFMGVDDAKDQFISLREALENQDIDAEIIKDFESFARPGILDVDNSSDEAKESLSKFVGQMLKFAQGIKLSRNGVRIAALIGPTGVGKTTTLAKIAAKFVLEKNAKVALITADTYRISAVEQLKTYADILGLPLETVYTPMELARAIRKHNDKNLILIDTAGRSQFNREQMRELQDFLKISPHIERHLVLSATTRSRDANAIIERFSVCSPNRLVITKTDETSSTGSLLGLLKSKNISLSYVTHGQSVPDDILPASADVFADVLLNRINNDEFDDNGI